MRHLLRSTFTASLCSASLALHPKQAAYDSSLDIRTSGLYSIQGCGSNATSIAAILDLLPPYLEPAITDTHSTRTSPAYNTFFKDVTHAPFVRTILQNIAYGTPVLPGLAQPGFNKVSSPVIACILSPPLSNPSPELVGLTLWVQAFARADCNTYRGGHPTYGLFIGGTNIVVLCPFWFSSDVPVEPKSRRPCTGVDRASNQFRGMGYPLARNRRAWLLHELAHVYLVAATNMRVPVKEVYSVNDCFRLRADAQRYMPNNYVYYTGSMSLSSSTILFCTSSAFFNARVGVKFGTRIPVFSIAVLIPITQDVYYKCTNFPTVAFPDRELSTSSPNTTADAVGVNSTISIVQLP